MCVACFDRGGIFCPFCFVNDGTLTPEIVVNRTLFCMILVACVVYIGHGIFHPVEVLPFLPESVSASEILSSQTDKPQKIGGAPLS